MPRQFTQLLETLSHDDQYDLAVAILSDLPLAERIKVVLFSFSPSDQQELAAWLAGEEEEPEGDDDADPEDEEYPGDPAPGKEPGKKEDI